MLSYLFVPHFWHIVGVLGTSEVRKRLREDGAEPVGSTLEEFRKHIKRETRKWSEVIKKVGVRVD